MHRSLISGLRWFFTVVISGLWCAGSALADQNDTRLDELFTALAGATDVHQAAQLEARIWRIWSESERQEITILFARGRAAMDSGRMAAAVRLFSRIIDLQPDFAEAWNKRATVLYLQHKWAESVLDIEQTLALEPRHFGAISGLGLIFLARDDARSALQVFERVLEINPQSVSARLNVEWLRARLDIHGV